MQKNLNFQSARTVLKKKHSAGPPGPGGDSRDGGGASEDGGMGGRLL